MVEGEGNSRIVSREEMFSIAREKGLDLLLVNGRITPPVVKLLDYEEFVRESKKNEYQKSARKNKSNAPSKLKSISLKLKIDNHDLEWKVKKAKAWLLNGEKVQLIIKTPYEESETKEAIANNLYKKFGELIKDEGKAFDRLKKISQSQYSAVFISLESKKE